MEYRVLSCRAGFKSAETWEEAEAIAREELRKTPTVNGMVRPVVVWDMEMQTCIAVLTDDSNGVMVQKLSAFR